MAKTLEDVRQQFPTISVVAFDRTNKPMSTAIETKERPILFRGEMVRAIRDNRKRQTRRLVKWEPYTAGESYNWTASSMDLGFAFTGMPSSGHVLYSRDGMGCWNQRTKPVFCPYGQPGDRLWVRESFYVDLLDYIGTRLPKDRPADITENSIYYAADGTCCEQIPECSCAEVGKPKWRPSIHMPRWASRLTLELTAVRLERLQAITEDGAVAEGVGPGFVPYLDPELSIHRTRCVGHKPMFRKLWNHIHGDGAWERNEWVWVIEFKKL